MLSDPLVIAILYLGAALGFALVYYLRWQSNPDSFIVHQEMNLRPLQSWRRVREAQRINQPHSATPPVLTSMEALYAQYAELSVQEEKLAADLAIVNPELEQAKTQQAALGAQHMEEYVKKLTAFSDEQRTLNDKLAQEDLAKWKEALAKDPSDATLARIRSEGVVRPTSEIRSAHAIAIQTSVLKDFRAADAKVDELLGRQLKLSGELIVLRRAQATLLETWERQRLSRLTAVDFVYFSMGVATTNTFGDLIPNDRGIRLTIVVQLVTSIVLVGLFVNAVAK